MTKKDDIIKQLKHVYEGYKCAYKDNRFNTEKNKYIKDTKIIKKVCKNKICDKYDVYLRATVIDACYSTQIRRFNDLSKICGHLNLKKCPDPKSCNVLQIDKIIETIRKDNDIDKFPFSFLTKYFALHNRENRPIYDKYVQMYIDAYIKKLNKDKKANAEKYKKDFDRTTKNIYNEFYKTMEELKKDGKFSFKQFDRKIWLTSKLIQEIFSEVTVKDLGLLYKKNKKKDVINALLEDLKSFEEIKENDEKFFKALLNTHIKKEPEKKNKSQDNS